MANTKNVAFAARQKAAKALEGLGEAAEAALRKALDGNQPLEVIQDGAQSAGVGGGRSGIWATREAGPVTTLDW